MNQLSWVMSAPGDEIAGDECAVMSPPMMSCPVTEKINVSGQLAFGLTSARFCSSLLGEAGSEEEQREREEEQRQ